MDPQTLMMQSALFGNGGFTPTGTPGFAGAPGGAAGGVPSGLNTPMSRPNPAAFSPLGNGMPQGGGAAMTMPGNYSPGSTPMSRPNPNAFSGAPGSAIGAPTSMGPGTGIPGNFQAPGAGVPSGATNSPFATGSFRGAATPMGATPGGPPSAFPAPSAAPSTYGLGSNGLGVGLPANSGYTATNPATAAGLSNPASGGAGALTPAQQIGARMMANNMQNAGNGFNNSMSRLGTGGAPNLGNPGAGRVQPATTWSQLPQTLQRPYYSA